MNKKVSVIIPNWNGKKWLKGLFADLKKQNYHNHEVIVVDNASTDGSQDYIRKYFPKVRLIESPTNLGFGRAINLGAKNAKGSELYFLNNDTNFPKDSLKALLEFKTKNKLNIVGPILLNASGVDVYQGRKITIDPLGVHGWGRETFYIDGCALLISKKDFRYLGGFDDQYFMYSEDIDLCWRALLYGMKLGVCPTTTLTHFGGGSSVATNKLKSSPHVIPVFRRYEVEKNNLRSLFKNYSSSNLLWVIPLYCFQQLLESAYYLLNANFAMLKTIWRAFYWNLVNITLTLKKRKIIQRRRKVQDRQLLLKMNLPFNKIRTFLQIGPPKYTDFKLR